MKKEDLNFEKDLQTAWKEQIPTAEKQLIFRTIDSRMRKRNIVLIIRTLVLILIIPIFFRINQSIESTKHLSEVGFLFIYSTVITTLFSIWNREYRLQKTMTLFLKTYLEDLIYFRKFYTKILPALALILIVGVDLVLLEIFEKETFYLSTIVISLATILLIITFSIGIYLHVSRINKEIRHVKELNRALGTTFG